MPPSLCSWRKPRPGLPGAFRYGIAFSAKLASVAFCSVSRDAAHGLVGLDLLALGAKKLSEAWASHGIDKIMAGRFALWPEVRLDKRELQHADGADAVGKGLNVRLIRNLPDILR